MPPPTTSRVRTTDKESKKTTEIIQGMKITVDRSYFDSIVFIEEKSSRSKRIEPIVLKTTKSTEMKRTAPVITAPVITESVESESTESSIEMVISEVINMHNQQFIELNNLQAENEIETEETYSAPPFTAEDDEEYEERFSLRMNKSEELGLGCLTNGINNNDLILSHDYEKF